MKIKIIVFLFLSLVSCSPEFGNFFYVNNPIDLKNNNEYYDFTIQDSINGSMVLEEFFATFPPGARLIHQKQYFDSSL
jgi:hypothetical protein